MAPRVHSLLRFGAALLLLSGATSQDDPCVALDDICNAVGIMPLLPTHVPHVPWSFRVTHLEMQHARALVSLIARDRLLFRNVPAFVGVAEVLLEWTCV